MELLPKTLDFLLLKEKPESRVQTAFYVVKNMSQGLLYLADGKALDSHDLSEMNGLMQNLIHRIFTEDYTVNTVTLTGIKRIVDFNGYQLKGGDNTGLDAVFEFTGLYCVIKQIDVSCEYRDYKCAMRWHSLSSAAGSSNNTIYGMFFRSCIIGLVFGNFQGELSIDAPQSENVIYDFKTRACKIAFVGNQLNGFVTMVAPVLDCYFHEWSALAAFDAAAQEEWNLNCMVFDNPECRLNIVGGELLKTASQTGVGMRGRGFCISGGTTFEVGCVQVEFTGEATIANQLGGFQGGPAGSPMFKISAGASAGAIKIHDADFRRTAGAVLGIGGTHTAIEFGDNTSDVFFSIDGCEFGEWLPRQFRLDDRIKITNTSFTDSTQTKYRYINSDTLNELPQYGVDHRCQTLTGWFENFGYGNAGNYTIGADGPAGYPALSIQMATTGRSDTSFVDLTSAASIMATAIRVTPTEIWEFQGHIKSTHAAANRSRVEINYFDDSGVSVSDVVIAVPTAVSTWEKFIASEEIPAGVFFIGVRFRAEIATFNYADISVNKISVVTPVT